MKVDMRNRTQAMEIDDPIRSMTSIAKSWDCERSFATLAGAVDSFGVVSVEFRDVIVLFDVVVLFVQGKVGISNPIVVPR
jgi:hypothetical protein